MENRTSRKEKSAGKVKRKREMWKMKTTNNERIPKTDAGRCTEN